jgi:hypothetical protein
LIGISRVVPTSCYRLLPVKQSKPEDQEYLIDGIVALGTLEAKGVKLHLGELFRKLKRFFGKKGDATSR